MPLAEGMGMAGCALPKACDKECTNCCVTLAALCFNTIG